MTFVKTVLIIYLEYAKDRHFFTACFFLVKNIYRVSRIIFYNRNPFKNKPKNCVYLRSYFKQFVKQKCKRGISKNRKMQAWFLKNQKNSNVVSQKLKNSDVVFQKQRTSNVVSQKQNNPNVVSQKQDSKWRLKNLFTILVSTALVVVTVRRKL
jgi:hypothetical protein